MATYGRRMNDRLTRSLGHWQYFRTYALSGNPLELMQTQDDGSSL